MPAGDLSAAAGRSMDALRSQLSLCSAAVQQHVGMFGPLPMNQIPPQAALAAVHQQLNLAHASTAAAAMQHQLPSNLPLAALPSMSSSSNSLAAVSAGIGSCGGLPLSGPSVGSHSLPAPSSADGAPLPGMGCMQQLLLLHQHYLQMGMQPAAAAIMAAAAVVGAGFPPGTAGLMQPPPSQQQQLGVGAGGAPGNMFPFGLPSDVLAGHRFPSQQPPFQQFQQ